MRKTLFVWHTLAQSLAIAWLLGCSGRADELETDDPPRDDRVDDARTPDDPPPETDSPDDVRAAPLEPMATAIRVINRSDRVRSRYQSCTGPHNFGSVRPESVAELPPVPTCSPIECADLGASDIVTPTSSCSAPACAPARIDLAPGDADVDIPWDGIFWSLTERNCYEPQSFELGTPVVVRVCFGSPGPGDYDASGFVCEDHTFAYGEALVEIALE